MSKLLNVVASSKKFEIKCKSETEADVIIYDDIGKDSFWFDSFGVKDLDKELRELPDTVDLLNVRINSPGGSVFEGYAIYNRLRQHKARVVVYIDGIAASIASIIAMAGDEIIMGEASGIMIHKPWTCLCGDAKDMEETINLLDGLEEQMINVYKKVTGKDSTELRQMLAAETWLWGQDAVDEGFATRMSEDGETFAAAASLDKQWFAKKPDASKLKNIAKEKVNSFKEEVEGFLART